MERHYKDKAQEVIEIDIKQFLEGLAKKWWQTLLVAIFLAGAGYLFSFLTYVPSYTSTATFVVSNRANYINSQSDSLTSSDLSASTTLANTFKYILLSDEAIYSIIEEYELPYNVNEIKSYIHVSPVTSTNILQMSVTTNDAALSKNVADKIIQYYPAVLARTLKTASLDVLNAPRVAAAPDGYNGFILYPLVGVMAALFISIAFVYIRLTFSNTIKTSADIKDLLNLKLMASVPRVISEDKKKKDPVGLLINQRSSGFLFSESIKALRTKVESVSNKKGYRTFVVTSSLENEGKTTVAVNLAFALAANGKKVLLIDADLRKPSISKYLNMPNTTPYIGIDSVIKGEASLETAITRVDKFGFHVLLNIREIANSSELLSSESMKDTLMQASNQYDFVIIDSSPANLLTDSVVMTAYTDAVLFVVRQDYASSPVINDVVENLTENQAELIGCVFTLVDHKGMGYGSNKHNKYGHYGKYYKYNKYSSYSRYDVSAKDCEEVGNSRNVEIKTQYTHNIHNSEEDEKYATKRRIG